MDLVSPERAKGRRRRDPAATREAILAAAMTVLASDGRDALSLTKVAQLAGVNRGTAYQHFNTREDLVKATVAWVSERLADTVFGAPDDSGFVPDATQRPVYEAITGLVDFAVENPGLGRVWLFEVLASDNPGEDVFFKRFELSTKELADSEFGAEGIARSFEFVSIGDGGSQVVAQQVQLACQFRSRGLKLLVCSLNACVLLAQFITLGR